MASYQLNTQYRWDPAVVTRVSGFLQKAVIYDSLGMQNIPVDPTLTPIQQKYEWKKTKDDIGVAYELDPFSPPDSVSHEEFKSISTPLVYANKTLTMNELERINMDEYTLQMRLAEQSAQMALRADNIIYNGDTKYALDGLATATPGTEVTTQLDVSTPTLAVSTFTTMFGQLEAALKYNNLIGPQSSVIIEMNPDVYNVAAGTTTATEDNSALEAIERILKARYRGPNSKVVNNWLLGATTSVNSAGKLSITSVGSDKILIYVQDPRIMKVLTSPAITRISPLDETKGQTFQPQFRLRRQDVEPLGVLVETDTKTA